MDSMTYKIITSGDIDQLKQIDSNDLPLQMTHHSNNTTLHVAVLIRRTLCVEEICNRCPLLLTQPNLKGGTPLLIAARLGSSDMVKVLIGHAKIHREDDVERGKRGGGSTLVEGSSKLALQQLVRMSNKENDTALHKEVRYHRFKVVKFITESDPSFEYFANNAGETPLYIASEKGLYDFVVQILQIRPSSAHRGPAVGLQCMQ